MNRKLLAILCAIAMLTLILTACSPAQEEGGDCTHPLSENWESDAKNHWKPTTCEHSEFRSEPAPHEDANEDGKCDVCAYEVGHTHTYSAEWSSDGENHWHAATCTHTAERAEQALHKDENTDGNCDVCAHHVHIVDSSGYCTLCDEKVYDIEAGDGDENDGTDDGEDDTTLDNGTEEETDTATPDGGSEPTPDSGSDPTPEVDTDAAALAKILAAIFDRSPTKIVSGKVDYGVVIRSNAGIIEEGDTVEYVIYTDGTYTKRTEKDALTSGTRVTEVWMELIDAENEILNAISVESLDGKVDYAEPVSVGVDNLAGYYFAVSTLASEYGAETVLKALYEHALSDTASDFTVVRDKDNRTFTFSYNILIINTDTAEGEDDGVDYYEVEVKLGYTEDYILTALEIVCDCYTNSLADESENDYVYDQASKTITMKETATADTYTFIVAQTPGTRTAIDMEDAEQFVPSDVTIYEDEAKTKPATSITLKLGAPADSIPNFYVGCPEGTYISFVKNAATVSVDREGLTASLVGEAIQIYPAAAGTYVITLTFGDVSKSVTVVIEDEDLAGANQFTVNVTDTYAWVDLYTFTATASGTYTFHLPYGLGAWDQAACEDNSGAPYVDYQGMDYDGKGSFSVDIAAGKTYSFYVSAIRKGSYRIGYDFVAKDVVVEEEEKPTVNTTPLTVGNNNIERKDVTYSYTAPTAGELTLTLSPSIMGTAEVTFTVNGGAATALAVNSTSGALPLNAGDRVIVSVVANGAYVTLTAAWVGESFDPISVGENSVSVSADDVSSGGKKLSFTPSATGSYTVAANGATVRIFDGATLLGTGVAALEAGKTYTVQVVCDAAKDYVVTVSITPDGTEALPIPVVLPAQGLAVKGDSSTYLWYTVTTTDEGILTVTYSNANSWLTLKNVNHAQDSKSGSRAQSFTFELQANSTYVLGLGVWDAEEGVTASLSFKAQALPKDGDAQKPLSAIAGNNVCSYPGGDASKFVWYKFQPTINGVLTVALDKAATVKHGTAIDAMSEASTATTLEIAVSAYTPVYIAIQSASLSAEEIAFSLSASEYAGTNNNPLTATVGENVGVTVAGLNEVYFKYRSAEKGAITLTCTEGTVEVFDLNEGGWIVIEDGGSYNVNAGKDYKIRVSGWAEGATEVSFTLTFNA